ncbi:MAG: ComF family protein [Candidatus Merdivicinus sp.]
MDSVWKEKLWRILFPAQCPFCGKPVAFPAICCDSCAANLPYLKNNPYQIRDLPVFSPFSYEGLAEQAVWRLKFYQKPSTARPLADFLANVLPDSNSFDCIIPIPMDAKKLRKRGYNQAALLARFLSEKTGIPVLPEIQKIRPTAEQHTLNAKERQTNLRDAYRLIHPDRVKDRHILLCDDVITTGATIQEAASLLMQAGAASVTAAAVTLASVFPETQS